jgi:hypothetical protein
MSPYSSRAKKQRVVMNQVPSRTPAECLFSFQWTTQHYIIITAVRTSKFNIIWTSLSHIRFEVFTVVTMKNAVFWDVMPHGSCKNQSFGGTYHFRHQGDKIRQAMNNVSSN